MDDIILNPKTKLSIDSYLKQPVHAVGLVAPAGAGKGIGASFIATKLLDIPSEKLNGYPYSRHIRPIKGVITIDVIRELMSYLKLKTTGQQAIRRVVIIEDAHTLTVEAQNTLLKTIEEPPTDTVLILTIKNQRSVLPTVLSRLHVITVHSPNDAQLLEYYQQKGYKTSEIQKYSLISSGLPGLMQAMLDSNEEHPVLAAINNAKELLKADTFGRLVQIDEIVKQKNTDELLFALSQIAHAGLLSAANSGNEIAVKRWGKMLLTIQQSKEYAASNVQTKLLLTNLCIQL